jgi:hypothetical protein
LFEKYQKSINFLVLLHLCNCSMLLLVAAYLTPYITSHYLHYLTTLHELAYCLPASVPQAHQVLTNMRDVLEAAGSELSKVVKVTVLLTYMASQLR